MIRARPLALCVAALALAWSARAAAYVRYLTDTGKPFFWAQATVPITAYPDDFTQTSMTPAQLQGAITASAATWSMNTGANACTYLTLLPTFASGGAPAAGNDGHSTVVFHSKVWCRVDANGDCPAGAEYDPSALAVTTDTANTATGQIYDADVEVNSLIYQWADVVADPQLVADMDLQNALTHEFGHLIGLDHTCWDALTSKTPLRPDDNNGQPVPDCATASADVQATTMFPSATPGDIEKRDLAPDDQDALCQIYNVNDPPPPPGTDATGGCNRQGCAVGGSLDLGALGASVALAALVGLRRRARRPMPR
jgi:hypothetical protein